MIIKAMKQALDALDAGPNAYFLMNTGGIANNLRKAISELEQRSIAEAQKQKPVAWMYQCSADSSGPCFMQHKTNWAESGSGLWTETPLYTHPPKREWVGLTDEDLYDCFSNDPTVAMKNAEQTLKEKNT